MPHAIQFTSCGDYKQTLQYNEVPKPTLQKDTEILVKVTATSCNPSDLGIIAGGYMAKPTFPASPGLEGTGVVEAIGSAVTTVKAGQRIHFTHFGSWQDYIVIDTKASDIVVPLPDSISDTEAAQLTVNPLTVWAMLHDLQLKFGSGDFLLQSAAASALGRFVIQLGKLKGFKTINLVRRDDQIEELKALGADYVINTEAEDLVEKVKEITQGAGVKYAIDAVGGKVGAKMISALGLRGQVLIFGRLDRELVTIDPSHFISKGVGVKGFWLAGWAVEHRDKAPGAYGEIIQWIASKQIKLTSKTFPAKDVVAAIDHSKTPGKAEKTILLYNQ